jgi:hypothetical protein
VQIFEIVSKKRNFPDGGFPYKNGIARNKAHHCHIQIAKMIGQEDIGLAFFEGAFNFNFHWQKNEGKEAFGPILVDFPSILIPGRVPNAAKE